MAENTARQNLQFERKELELEFMMSRRNSEAEILLEMVDDETILPEWR